MPAVTSIYWSVWQSVIRVLISFQQVDFDNVAALTGYKDAKAAKEMWRVLKKNKLTTNSGQENGDEAAEAFGVTKTTTPKKGKGKAVKQNGSEDSEAVETPKTGKGRSKKTATSTPRKRKSGEVDDDAEVEATPTKRARARTPKKAKAATKKNAKEEEEGKSIDLALLSCQTQLI